MAEQGPLSGETVGDRYVLDEFLGEGGSGVVYKAHHLQLHRQQAVKILLESHFSENDFGEHFLREAQKVAALDHPNIIHLDDFWVEPPRTYLAMSFMKGGTLQDVLRNQQGPLELEQIVFCVKRICAALQYAHAKGVAHLNLKPSNILVDDNGRLLLADFGLAHPMRTPHYMAPEQLRGNPETRSDVFSLGVILYQMLTGRLPFDGSIPETIHKIQTESHPRPLRLLREGLRPSVVEFVIETALAKQPESRHPTANALWWHFKAALPDSVRERPFLQQEVPPPSHPQETISEADRFIRIILPVWQHPWTYYKSCPNCGGQCDREESFCDRCGYWFPKRAQDPWKW